MHPTRLGSRYLLQVCDYTRETLVYLLAFNPIAWQIPELKIVQNLDVPLLLRLRVGVGETEINSPMVGAEPPMASSILRVIMGMGHKLWGRK